MAKTAAALLLSGYHANIEQGNWENLQAQMEAGQIGMQAEELKLQAPMEKTAGATAELDRQNALNSVMAQQRAAFSGSGLSMSSGSFVAASGADMSLAAEQDNLAQTYQNTRQSGYRTNIKQLGLQKQQTLLGGKIARRMGKRRAINSLLNTGMQIGSAAAAG